MRKAECTGALPAAVACLHGGLRGVACALLPQCIPPRLSTCNLNYHIPLAQTVNSPTSPNKRPIAPAQNGGARPCTPSHHWCSRRKASAAVTARLASGWAVRDLRPQRQGGGRKGEARSEGTEGRRDGERCFEEVA